MRLSVPVLWITLVLTTTPLAAQRGPTIPLDDPSLPLFEHLITRGLVPDPTPFVRPVRRAAAVAALRTARPRHQRDQAILDQLLNEWSDAAPGDSWQVGGRLGAQWYGAARREPMQPAGEEGGGLFAEVRGSMMVGPVTIGTRVQAERRLLQDPDWPGREEAGDKNLAFRAADAYAAVAMGAATLTLGTLDRNWGPAQQHGLGVSAVAYPRTALALDLPTTPIGAWFVFAPLPSELGADGQLVERYYAAHRIALRPKPNVELAVWETTILADVADQGTDALGSLFGVMTFAAQFGRSPNTNTILGVDLRWRTPAGIQLEGQFAGDDIRLMGENREAGEVPRPDRWAVSFGARGPFPAGGSFHAHYERVTSLAYRTSNPVENYTADGIGLVRLVPDYDRATLRVSYPIGARLLLSPTLAVQRQGEGRLDQPAVFTPDTPIFLLGSVERSIRGSLGVSGRVQGASVHGDLGVTHRSGGQTSLTGRIILTLDLSAGGPLK